MSTWQRSLAAAMIGLLAMSPTSPAAAGVDDQALRRIGDYVLERFNFDMLLQYVPRPGGLCVGASGRLADDLVTQGCLIDAVLDGWTVQVVELGDCHNGVMLKSPHTGKSYYADSYTPFGGIVNPVEFREVSPGVWRPVNPFTLDVQLQIISDLCFLVEPQKAIDLEFSAVGGSRTISCQPASATDVRAGGTGPSDEPAICLLPRPQPQPHPVQPIGSFDPNDKVGPLGAGPTRVVGSGRPLTYAINFENLATATAPAQEVVVTDQLDLTKLDANTVALGPVTFGNTVLVPTSPRGTLSLETDLRPDRNLKVRVAADLDSATGIITWRFASLDPLTNEPVSDPLAGFLPPNVLPPQGQGSVTFSVALRAAIPAGTEIANQATIVFDTNPPIATPQWRNVVDTDIAPAFVAGRKLLLRTPGTPKRNKLVYLSKDKSTPVPRSIGKDPRCAPEGTDSGGSVRVVGAGGDFTIALPCARWSRKSKGKRYVYKDPTGETCNVVLVRRGALGKAVCKGSQVAYTLGAPQGDVAVAVVTGAPTTPLRMCAGFGPGTGTTIAKDGSDGRTYLAKSAGLPGACPP